jgi:hypothetical protein
MATESQKSCRASLVESIEALGDPLMAYPRGGACYIDPEEHEIVVWTSDGTPIRAWNRRWLSVCTIPERVAPKSLRDELLRIIDDLVTACGQYLGSEWDGGDLIGTWTDSPEDEQARYRLGEDLAFASFSDPGDWYAPVSRQIDQWVAAGRGAESIIDEIGCGDPYSDEGGVDRTDAIDFVGALIARADCAHSACSQNYIDTGDRRCIEEEL